MALDPVRPPETREIDCFDVHQEIGVYVALRRAPLTDYQQQYGCLARVVATTFDELSLLCHAERIKGELVAMAEMSVNAAKARR